MKTWLLKYWDAVRSSFWFVPASMAIAAAALAFAGVALDEAVTDEWMRTQTWAFTGSAEGASLLLATLAGSMITIAGTVFSMTLVALSLASSQLGPRLLRNFMRDKTNQAVLGTFVATFVYCLLVLRTIRRADAVEFVPHLSVTIAVLLAMISMGVLIYFIHHVSVSIQADEMIARVGTELRDGIGRLFPSTFGRDDTRDVDARDVDAHAAHPLPDRFEADARQVAATGDGYLQLIDADALMKIASTEDLVLRLDQRPGQYVIEGHALAVVWPPERLSDEIVERIGAAFVLGNQRTSVQDLQFGIDQLVEIAVRALSPGINDPFTAITCVNRLGSTLSRLARQMTPMSHRLDAEGKLRVVTNPPTFADFVDAAFNMIRHYGRDSAAVTQCVLENIALVGESAQRPDQRAALLRHAEMVARGAEQGLPEVSDRVAVADRFDQVRRALGGPSRS